jgi:CRISP-associated protein Cas1
VPSLYITEPGAVLRKRGRSLLVVSSADNDEDGRETTLLEVEPHRLETVVLVGNAHITSPAMRHCVRHGIGVAWLSFGGRFLARAVTEMPRSGHVRIAQYRRAIDEETALTLARKLVEAKIGNALSVARRLQRNSPSDGAAEAIRELKLRVTESIVPPNLPALLALEGRAARQYFSAYSKSLKGSLKMKGRTRRPPRDPVNAMLSFGYVLLANNAAALLEARGLDPSIGFLHGLRSGRASLALDLIEELRHPVVDRFVARACGLGILKPDDFELDTDDHGIRMTKAGLGAFLRHWNTWQERPLTEQGETGPGITPEKLLHRQVDRLAEHIATGIDYQPFRFRA